jgi:hypothetical protein
MLAFANDIDIIGRKQKDMKEAAKKKHLMVNQDKAKYMPVT